MADPSKHKAPRSKSKRRVLLALSLMACAGTFMVGIWIVLDNYTNVSNGGNATVKLVIGGALMVASLVVLVIVLPKRGPRNGNAGTTT